MSAVTKLTEDKSYRGGNCWENVTQPVSSATPPEALAASEQQWRGKKNKKPEGATVPDKVLLNIYPQVAPVISIPSFDPGHHQCDSTYLCDIQ